MSKKKNKKKNKFKLENISFRSIFIFACIALVFIEISFSISNKVIDINKKKNELANLQTQYEDVVQKNERLKEIIETSDVYDYQLEKAREFGYCFENEKIFYAIN